MHLLKETLLLAVIGLTWSSPNGPYGVQDYGYSSPGYSSQYYGSQTYRPSNYGSYGHGGYGYPPVTYQNYGYERNNYGYGPHFFYTDGYGKQDYGYYNQGPYHNSYGPSSYYGGYGNNYYPGPYSSPYNSYSPYGGHHGQQYGPTYGPQYGLTYGSQYGQQYGSGRPHQSQGPHKPHAPEEPVPPISTTTPSPQCDDVYQGNCYHFSWRHGATKLNWNQAVQYCEDRDMRAISLDIPEKSTYFLNLLKQDGFAYTWIGAFVKGHVLIWANGQQQQIVQGTGDWSNTGSTGRPQPERKDECVAVLNNFYGDGVKWHDIACHHPKPVICEETT